MAGRSRRPTTTSTRTARCCSRSVRFAPKDFRQRRPDGEAAGAGSSAGPGGCSTGCPPSRGRAGRRDRLPRRGREGRPTRSCARGVTATCSPMGAGKWRAEYAESLATRIRGDRRRQGRTRATARRAGRRRSLQGKAASVEIVEAAHGKDAYDHLGAGKTIDEFVERVRAREHEPTVRDGRAA